MKRSYLRSHSLCTSKNRKNILKLTLVLILLSNGVWIQQQRTQHAHATGVSPQAITVYGQAGSFTTATSGITSTTFNTPRNVIKDSTGGLYVSDYINNRVLYFPSNTTTASRVYGQNGSFTTGSINNTNGTANIVSATSLSTPKNLALDSGRNLYVTDNSNNRVLYFPSGSTTAIRVYGQGGSYNEHPQYHQ